MEVAYAPLIRYTISCIKRPGKAAGAEHPYLCIRLNMSIECVSSMLSGVSYMSLRLLYSQPSDLSHDLS